MDSRGIPIVLPGNKYASSPKRNTKRKTATKIKNEILPTYNVRSNEPSLLEVYDAFADACFQSHYNHSMLNDDYRYNIQDFYKTEMCLSDNFQSSLVPPSTPKRHKSNDSEISTSKVPDLQASRNSMFICSQQSEDVNYESEYMEEDGESSLNNLTVASATAHIASSVVQMRETVLPDFTDNHLLNSSTIYKSSMDISEQEQLNMNDVDMASQEISEPISRAKSEDPLVIDSAEPLSLEQTKDISVEVVGIRESELTTVESERSENENIKDTTNTPEVTEPNVDSQHDLTSNAALQDHKPMVSSTVEITDNAEPNVGISCASAIENEPNTITVDSPTTEIESVTLDELSKCSIKNEDLESSKDTSTVKKALTDSPAMAIVEEPPAEIQLEKPEKAPAETKGRRAGRPSRKSFINKSTEKVPSTPTRRTTRSQKNAETPTIPSPTNKRATRSNSSTPQPVLTRRMTRSQAKAIDQPYEEIKVIPKASPRKRSGNSKGKTEKVKEVVEEKLEEVLEEKTEEVIKEVVKEKSKEELMHEKEKEKYEKMRRERDKEEIDKIYESFPSLKNYYELVERAGRGTFSKVYKAKDLLADEYMPIDEKYKLNFTDASYVAVKVIFDISSPKRVADEIECLTMFRSSPCITPLITAFRHEAITYVILPYIEFDHFDDFYSDMTLSDVRSYISQLLIGLKSVHEQNIMHRDVKPGNFLYNNKTKVGYLADFGLAQKMHAFYPLGSLPNAQYTQHQSAGYYMYDRRLPFQANRSGTKGFRAPEIMLKYANQTTAIDIWAVGVILLIILGGKYPFFNPDDDADGIMEIAHLFGGKELKAFTDYYGRRMFNNIPSIPEEGCDLADLCRTINKDKVDSWDPQEYLLAADLMKQCLQLIHTNRCTASEALQHPFLQQQ